MQQVDDDDTWALHLVIRVERVEPPSRADAYRAVAGAVLELLHDERAESEWVEPLNAWRGRRIRKLVRRARGSGWKALEELDGVEFWAGDAQVRAFPPTTRAGMPRVLERLQVRGTDLPEPEPHERPDPAELAHDAPSIVLWLNPDVRASTGKLMAQVGHAAQLMDEHLRRRDTSMWAAWREAEFPLSVCKPSAAVWRQVLDLAEVAVADAGYTEVAPGTVTAAATVANGTR